MKKVVCPNGWEPSCPYFHNGYCKMANSARTIWNECDDFAGQVDLEDIEDYEEED